jgi:hypothetical protein
MSVVVNILAAVGLIVIVSYLSVYLYNFMKNKQTQQTASKISPPGDYMQASGIQCPDYWVNTGVDSKVNIICKNSFNIQSNNGAKCNSSVMKFTQLPPKYTWQFGNPSGLTSYTDKEKYDFLNKSAAPDSLSRCGWINNCGPSARTQGIWQGVNEICNNPPISS